MENAAVLTLAGICLGIALSGLIAVALGTEKLRTRLSLALVYLAFAAMVSLPLVSAFAPAAIVFYLPLLLVMLMVLPPAIYYYVLARTVMTSTAGVHWRDLVMPLIGTAVCVSYWALPAGTKQTLLVLGDLPPGVWLATLALTTFALILCWLVASFMYLIAILRRLAAYRAEVRQHYTDVERRDLRWIDLVMILLVMIWGASALSLADENLLGGRFYVAEVLFGLTACCLLALNIFAPIAPPIPPAEPEQEEPDQKYARSALTRDHTAKLAARIDTAMRNDTLFLDPSLSLQKLSRHVGAVPNQVSQTLNQEIGATFFDYVARWRIDASKPQILTGEASILAIALDVGFNSRSTFYKAFKRETGMTPKDFRVAQKDVRISDPA